MSPTPSLSPLAQTSLSRRGLLAMGSGAAAGLTLSACTSPNAPTGKPTGSSTPGGVGNGSPLTMLLLGPTPDALDWVNKTVIPSFKQATNTDVEVQSSDWGSAFQKVTTGAASNSLADVLIIGGIWTAPLASKGVLLDITDRVKAWDQTPEIYPGMLADGAYEGKNYGIPMLGDVRPGVYRQDLLNKAGVTDLPKTWEDFRVAAEKVKSSGAAKTPIWWATNKSIGLQQSFAILFLQAGGKYWDDSGKASFNSPQGKKALEFLVGTYKDGLADVNQIYSGSGPMPLASGDSAMTMLGLAVYRNAQKNSDTAPQFVAGPATAMDADSDPVAVAWVNKLAIAKNTKNPDGAWALVQTMTGSQYGGELSHQFDGLPARKDFANVDWLDDFGKQIAAASENAVSQQSNPVMMQLGPAVQTLLEPAIRGQASVDETLSKIDEKVNSLDA